MILQAQGNAEYAALIGERCCALIELGVPLLVFFQGDPTPYVEPAHAAGVKVAIQVGSPAEARRAADAGVDIVIAQGLEAGGTSLRARRCSSTCRRSSTRSHRYRCSPRAGLRMGAGSLPR